MGFFKNEKLYKICKTIILTFMVVITIGWVGYVVYTIPLAEIANKKELLNVLERAAQANKERANSYLFTKKSDLTYLTNSTTVMSVFGTHPPRLQAETGEFLQLFRETKQFRNVILINVDGVIFWSATDKELIGHNLNVESAKAEPIAQVFQRTKHDLGVGVYSPKDYDSGGRIPVYLTHPVLSDSLETPGKKQTLGFVVLEIDNIQLEQLIKEDSGLNYKGEVYIVNRQRQNITPINDSAAANTVDSLNIQNCFSAYDNYYISRQGEKYSPIPRTGEYLNYSHNRVYGAYAYILESNWCVIAEVENDSFWEVQRQMRNEKIKLQLKYLFALMIVGMMYFTVIDKLSNDKQNFDRQN